VIRDKRNLANLRSVAGLGCQLVLALFVSLPTFSRTLSLAGERCVDLVAKRRIGVGWILARLRPRAEWRGLNERNGASHR